MDCRFRPVFAIDEPFLWEMLYYAAHVNDEPGASVATAQQNPVLTKFVAHWGKPGDLGVLAYEIGTLEPVGAAWLRIFVGADKNCDAIEDGTPELAIAVAPPCLGKGVGTQLLTHLLSAAATSYPAVYLNVRETNPAQHLYERFGFVVIGELTNRVGSKSLHMVKSLRTHATESILGK